MMNNRTKSIYRPPALIKAARILEHLAEACQPVRLSYLAAALGYSKSTLHGILAALEEQHWVQRDGPRAGYRVGGGLLELSRKAFGFWELPEMAKPLMERVAEAVGESVFLGRRRGDQVVILACVEGRSDMRVTSPPGTVLPLLAAAVGKVFLAGMSRTDARRMLDRLRLPRFTERSILDPEAFLAHVERVRSKGYSTDDEEYLRGIRAIAAPVTRHKEIVAAMWIVGFVSSLTDAQMEAGARALLEATGILSRLLEARGPL